MLKMISETDDCHSINIACFISVKVHCIIMWIYTGTAFKACNPLQSKSFYASCDSISLLFTLLVLSSLASKVNIYSNLNLNFGVKIEFCSLGKKAVLLFQVQNLGDVMRKLCLRTSNQGILMKVCIEIPLHVGSNSNILSFFPRNPNVRNYCQMHMSHFAYACKMRYPLNLVLESWKYLWFY